MIRPIGKCLAAVAVAATTACGSSTTDPFGPIPFDPTGDWTAEVTGELLGSPMSEEMALSLSVVRDDAAQTNTVDLAGTWEWAGLSGSVDAMWQPHDDERARESGNCPIIGSSCSLRLTLEPPPSSCWEVVSSPLGGGPTYVVGLGWFEGSEAFVAATMRGTYWEGAFNSPCLGPVLLSIDAVGLFSRT